jgi:EAL and modified HD-GYP domain-containing signal transduction protein
VNPAAESAGQQQLLLARQPVFDTALNVVAYELLHRSMDPARFSTGDGDAASSQLLLDAFGPAGIADITEGKPALINFTEHLILHPPAVPPGLIIVEVLEDVRPTPRVIAGLRALRERGFGIALDDFRHHAALEPLLALADIVKLDVLAMSEPELRAEVRKLRNHPLRLLAEKIESWEMHNHCADLGFSYFQGFFLSHPQAVHGERQGPDQVALRAQLDALLRAGSQTELAQVLGSRDPMPGLRLLRLANGPDSRNEDRLETLEQALAALGPRAKGRSCIAVLASIEHKPRELLRLALARARACERLGEACSPAHAGSAFEAGVLSLIDAFLDAPAQSPGGGLGAAPGISAEGARRTAETGAWLATAIAFEKGEWSSAPWEELARLGVGKAEAEQAYLESLRWARRAMQAMFNG